VTFIIPEIGLVFLNTRIHLFIPFLRFSSARYYGKEYLIKLHTFAYCAWRQVAGPREDRDVLEGLRVLLLCLYATIAVCVFYIYRTQCIELMQVFKP